MPALNRVAAVWLIDARGISGAALDPARAWLGASEAARYQRFVRPRRQRQFLIGRILLRQALGRLLGVPAATLGLIECPGAAPQLVLPDPTLAMPGFSLSHSGDWIACAVSADTALGLDIEVIDAVRDIDALAGQAFDAGQVAYLSSLDGAVRRNTFYRMWSEQEARYKLGECAAPSCIALAHASLSVVLCSAQPLAAVPTLTCSDLTLC